MDTTLRLTTVDGATIAYRRRPAALPATGLPLVLIHGAASNMTRWSEFADTTALADRHDLLRLDLRGHGQSLYRGRIGLEIWADDIAAILQQEKIARAILVGHCLGANVAATFGLRHPERTSGLVLVEPMLRDALTGALRRLVPFAGLLTVLAGAIRLANRLGLYRRHLPTLDLRELDREFRQRLAEPGGAAALERRYASPLQDLRIMPSANFFQDMIEVIRPLAVESLDVPFLALLSTGRTFADPDITRALLAHLPQGAIQTLESKHWIPTEQPEAMRNAIDNWCDKIR